MSSTALPKLRPMGSGYRIVRGLVSFVFVLSSRNLVQMTPGGGTPNIITQTPETPVPVLFGLNPFIHTFHPGKLQDLLQRVASFDAEGGKIESAQEKKTRIAEKLREQQDRKVSVDDKAQADADKVKKAKAEAAEAMQQAMVLTLINIISIVKILRIANTRRAGVGAL